MTSGDVLSRWLQRQHGSTVRGSLVSLSRGGLLRVSDVQSRPVRVVLPVVHGGQAAVARAVDQTGVSLALRVQAVSSDAEKARQMERLVNRATVAEAARAQPDRFPAVLPVLESFVLVVPGADVPVTAPESEYELWCDLMAWCPHDLNGWAQTVPVASREPGAVLGAFVPVLTTVHAVHQDLGIVHRDITPNNVLVDSDDQLLLADWGIAHGLASDQTSTYTQLVGNRGFSLPPEMLAGDPSVGRYTDAWYLGSLLAWMLTGQTPGPQHGPGWLPPGLPDGAVGEQVTAVIQSLCWPDPRGRMDLGQAQAVLVDAAAGRVSANLTGPATSTFGPAVPGATASDQAPGPTVRLTGGPTGLLAGPAYGSPPLPPSYDLPGPTDPQSHPGMPTDSLELGLDDRPSFSRTWRRVAAIAVVVVVAVVAAALWAPGPLSRDRAVAPAAGPTSGRTAPSTAPSQSAADPDEPDDDDVEQQDPGVEPEDSAGLPGQVVAPGQTVPGQTVPGQTVPGQPAPGQTVTGATYSAARIYQILDDLYAATGGKQFTKVNFYPEYVIATAPTAPGEATFDDFTWRSGKVTHKLSPIQPKSDDLFDATTVSWSQAEVLARRMPELTGVDSPDKTYVFVSRGVVNKVLQFQLTTSDGYYNPVVRADPSGNITQMTGGRPGTPAAG
ncbi:MAG: protein kinase [Micrococcales bacterium]|nr:protein kinase [Micrococcales bacterium]